MIELMEAMGPVAYVIGEQLGASNEPMRAKVDALQSAMMQLPQAELETQHYFADGMYARVLFRAKDVRIVGKVHKREHFYIVAKGRVAVTVGEEVKVLEAGAVLVSKPGTKRAVVALEDSICLTVHRTKKKNLDKIEHQLIEPEPLALFDARNQRRLT